MTRGSSADGGGCRRVCPAPSGDRNDSGFSGRLRRLPSAPTWHLDSFAAFLYREDGCVRRFPKSGPRGLEPDQGNSVITGNPLDGTYEPRQRRLRDAGRRDPGVGWSQLATDIAVSKYFRKAGVNGDAKKSETSVRQMVHRVARTIREAGDALRRLLRDEGGRRRVRGRARLPPRDQYGRLQLARVVQLRPLAPLRHRGPGRQLGVGREDRGVLRDANAYERPQCSACFIQSVDDDLMSIYDLVKTEARLFKYGSGTGTNFSASAGGRRSSRAAARARAS
jgi:hypothetical protein